MNEREQLERVRRVIGTHILDFAHKLGTNKPSL